MQLLLYFTRSSTADEDTTEQALAEVLERLLIEEQRAGSAHAEAGHGAHPRAVLPDPAVSRPHSGPYSVSMAPEVGSPMTSNAFPMPVRMGFVVKRMR